MSLLCSKFRCPFSFNLIMFPNEPIPGSGAELPRQILGRGRQKSIPPQGKVFKSSHPYPHTVKKKINPLLQSGVVASGQGVGVPHTGEEGIAFGVSCLCPGVSCHSEFPVFVHSEFPVFVHSEFPVFVHSEFPVFVTYFSFVSWQRKLLHKSFLQVKYESICVVIFRCKEMKET
jgi:hypothetical protein